MAIVSLELKGVWVPFNDRGEPLYLGDEEGQYPFVCTTMDDASRVEQETADGLLPLFCSSGNINLTMTSSYLRVYFYLAGSIDDEPILAVNPSAYQDAPVVDPRDIIQALGERN